MKKSIEERIKYLEHCANLYETSGNSPLTDNEYDKEYAELKKIAPDNYFFSKVGGMDEAHIYGTKYTHKYTMGSLEKDPNPDEFGNWFKKTYEKDIDKVVAILQLKVDGSSFCLHYQDGKLIRAVSRGNGLVGLDYTKNAKHIRGVLETISARGYVEIKGEVYKNKQDFEKYFAEEFANDRNFTAGAINQKDPLVTKERGLDFVAYEVRGIDFKTETEKTKFLIDNGFANLDEYTSKINCKGKTVKDVVDFITLFMNNVDKENLPFSIDGIVFKLDDIEWAESLGTTDEGKRPKSNRAIKFPTEIKETILEGIEWSVGRTGALTPVALLQPVQLAGTTVKRATIHNLKEMERLGINKIGCTVKLQKSGDIIPKILEMTKAGNKKIEVPENCPSCNSKLEWDDTNTTKFCHNNMCPSQVNSSIEHYFKTIDVLGIGEGIIERLINKENNMVNSISDMYTLNKYKSQLSSIFGPKATENLLEAINSVKEISLAKFIEALGIGKIGRMSKDITEIAPTVEAIDKLTIPDILNIHGFAEIKAKNFIDGWKSQRKEIDKLLKHIKIQEAKKMSGKLNGNSFCITGTLSRPRNDFIAIIEENGGRFASSVSAKLNFLICGSDCGSKKDKAEKLGVQIISEEEFNEML